MLPPTNPARGLSEKASIAGKSASRGSRSTRRPVWRTGIVKLI
jgi:hypothetical protein